MVPNSTSLCFVNSQLVSLLPVGILNKFLFHLQYLFIYFAVSSISTVVLSTLTLNFFVKDKPIIFLLWDAEYPVLAVLYQLDSLKFTLYL